MLFAPLKMGLGSGNSFGKKIKSVGKLRRIVKKILTELWDFGNKNWNAGNDKWDD